MTGRDGSAPAWVDHGVVPPQRVPALAEEAAAYLAEALGHPVYERWTWTRLVKVYGALPDARRAKPAACRILIDAPEAVEVWQRGRLRVQPVDHAPDLAAVVQALLATHGKRFRQATAEPAVQGAVVPATGVLPDPLSAWLQRRGRLANMHADTNTLGAIDDHAAVAAFLRERAARSRHTWRAYLAELQRLVLWCQARGRGPLSDLTRQDLLAYRQALGQPVIESEAPATDQTRTASVLSQRSQARALAVVASLFGHWHDTGYLLGNPAAGLVSGARTRAGFTPKRFVPAPLLQSCDAWVVRSMPAVPSAEALRRWRQVAVWTVFRCTGVRLAELAWAPDAGLPRLEVDEHGSWTLQVLGKGDKERAIPLPRPCAQVLRAYRQARGLPALPGALERVPLIHGEKGSALGARGLYEEVKAVLLAVADEIEPVDAAGSQLLRAVSPHWLRHAYARTLVVDKGVPLPAAQALLGHASVQTTAEYAKTDLSKLREFVELGFGDEANGSGSTTREDRIAIHDPLPSLAFDATSMSTGRP